MELLIKVKDSEAPFLLELLEKFDFVEVEKAGSALPVQEPLTEPTFEAVRFNQPGFTFTRDEANER